MYISHLNFVSFFLTDLIKHKVTGEAPTEAIKTLPADVVSLISSEDLSFNFSFCFFCTTA